MMASANSPQAQLIITNTPYDYLAVKWQDNERFALITRKESYKFPGVQGKQAIIMNPVEAEKLARWILAQLEGK